MINDFYSGMKVSLDGENGIVLDKANVSSYGIIRWDTEKVNDTEDWCGLYGSFIDSGGIILAQNFKFKNIKEEN